MIRTNRNVMALIESSFSDCLDTISNISRNDNAALVDSNFKMYNFDKICERRFTSKKKPTSADALYINSNTIYFFEFKTGFSKRITRDNLDYTKAKCKALVSCIENNIEGFANKNPICDHYWKYFWKSSDQDLEIIRNSIRMKAVESFIFLTRGIIPLCPITTEITEYSFVYVAVIDADATDVIEQIGDDLAGTSRASKKNEFRNLSISLKRLINVEKNIDNFFYYDHIYVVPPSLFKKELESSYCKCE